MNIFLACLRGFLIESCSGKPTMATMPPCFIARLAATGNAANHPSALGKARSMAASTFTTLAEIKPALVTKRT